MRSNGPVPMKIIEKAVKYIGVISYKYMEIVLTSEAA